MTGATPSEGLKHSVEERGINVKGSNTFTERSTLVFGSMSSSFSFAIDRGGTFTDVFCVLPGKRATRRGLGFLTSIKFVRLSFL